MPWRWSTHLVDEHQDCRLPGARTHEVHLLRLEAVIPLTTRAAVIATFASRASRAARVGRALGASHPSTKKLHAVETAKAGPVDVVELLLTDRIVDARQELRARRTQRGGSALAKVDDPRLVAPPHARGRLQQ